MPALSPLQAVFQGHALTPPPLWLMRQAGRYLPGYQVVRKQAGSFLNLCLTPELATQVTLQPIERFGFDAAIIFSDILILPYALGHPLEFNEGPKMPRLFQDLALQDLKLNFLEERLQNVVEAIQRVVKALPPQVDLIGFCGAPWTLTSYMIEGQKPTPFYNMRLALTNSPQEFSALISLLTEAIIRSLSLQIKAGATLVQLFDSRAGEGINSEEEYDQWILQPTKTIVSALKNLYPHIPVIGFPRGVSRERYALYAQVTQVDGLSVDYDTSLGKMKLIAQDRDSTSAKPLVLQGNLAPDLLVTGGEAMETAIKNILQQTAGSPFIFNLGHGILPTTPPHYVKDLITLVRSHRAEFPQNFKEAHAV